MISRRQGSSASACAHSQRRRASSRNLHFAPLVTRLAAKHKFQLLTHKRIRIPLSFLPINNAKAPLSEPMTAGTPFPSQQQQQQSPSQNLSNKMSTVAAIPPQYVREKLAPFRPSLYAGLCNVKYATSPQQSSVLPKELQIIIDEHLDAVPPTHILAVYTASAAPSRPKVTLYPAHDIVLSSHCANLPRLPQSVSSSSRLSGSRMTVPVVPLSLPSPQTYSLLQTYLYTQNLTTLESSLLPSLGELDLDSLLRRLAAVHGLAANARALGVADASLHQMLERVWASLRVAVIKLKSHV